MSRYETIMSLLVVLLLWALVKWAETEGYLASPEPFR
jgi:hypothetical protein